MVAATFPNLSFENPPGTGPTLLSSSSEPFALEDEQVLLVTVANIQYSVVFLATDFADIGAATTDEVCSAFNSQIEEVVATNDGGYVRLLSTLTGADVTLGVTNSGANAAFGFSDTPVTGETYAGGAPNGWSVASDVYSTQETAEFSDENGRPEETFSEWGTTANTSLDPGYFDLATIPTPHETFTAWATTGLMRSTALEAAVFDGIDLWETFEKDWGTPIYFALVSVHLFAGLTDTFDAGWNNPVGDPTFEDATFANGTLNADNFEDNVVWTHIVTILSNHDGEWLIDIDGEKYSHVASGDTPAEIATELASRINTGSARAVAQVNSNEVRIAPSRPDITLSVFALRPAGGTIQHLPATESSVFVEYWVGQDALPGFV